MREINKNFIDQVLSKNEVVTEDKPTINSVIAQCHSNVVNEKKLKKVQLSTLDTLRDYLAKTFGPMGSYTGIISGSNPADVSTTYSKDGLKVLKHIIFDSPIEMALQSELVEVCRYVEKMVGDGTTSAVILSSYIYSGLCSIMNEDKIPPRKITMEFSKIVEALKKMILFNKREITLDDIYNICMISTNGNKLVSENIKNMYNEYGFDVNIEVSISNDSESKLKEYNGLSIDTGYSDPAYINNPVKGTCELHDVRVYNFLDPVDTPEMITFFEKIIMDNIISCFSTGEDYIPTVIMCPMISRDGLGLLNKLVEAMYEFDHDQTYSQKPPILILTNIHGADESITNDIAKLCNCKSIHKYINPEVQQHEQETGEAPTLETIHNFAGNCGVVSADMNKTNFIDTYDSTENDNKIYNNLISFLKSELKNAVDNNEDIATVGILKKRLRYLEANIVEYLVGGISISDRDSLKDLVEDAVKNCASAAANGVGRAANFEGLISSYEMLIDCTDNHNTLSNKIIEVIFKAYYNTSKILYSTVVSEDDANKCVLESMKNDCPFNVVDLLDEATDIDKEKCNVLTSIMTDIEILDAISKIVSMIVTSNQCLLQNTAINRY